MKTLLEVENFSFFYGKKQALHSINMTIPENRVTAFIGPSGCGKSTLLRNFNRMNDLVWNARHEGSIRLAGQNIFDRKLKVINIRRQIGMVFQKSNPFPRSIYENVIYSLRLVGERSKKVLDQAVEENLRKAALWDETKDRLHDSALGLSGGQMQRLCIARAIACKPRVLLMDEPCSALDPIATAKVEDLMHGLKTDHTIVIVTHSMAQAQRTADLTAFFYLGKVVEHAPTQQLFTSPAEKQTLDYLEGRFG